MNYTDHRRRAMNKAVKAMYPDIHFTEGKGTPVLECETLPQGVVRIENEDGFIQRVIEHCSRINNLGARTPDYSKAFPIFIRSMELCGTDTRHFYRVNYVSATSQSQQRVSRYIAEGKLFASKDTCNP